METKQLSTLTITEKPYESTLANADCGDQGSGGGPGGTCGGGCRCGERGQ